jgi:hypothetical protein
MSGYPELEGKRALVTGAAPRVPILLSRAQMSFGTRWRRSAADSPDVTGKPPVAHYTHDPKTFDGFVFPTRRLVHLHDAKGIADRSFARSEQAVVSNETKPGRGETPRTSRACRL